MRELESNIVALSTTPQSQVGDPLEDLDDGDLDRDVRPRRAGGD